MEAYPQGALDHNAPFIVASGLNSAPQTQHPRPPGGQEDDRVWLESQLPPLESREADVLDNYFTEVNARGASWAPLVKDETYRYRIESVGRTYALPPRRAPLPDSMEPPEQSLVLHSPFSPLSTSSPLYPDGLINTEWVLKHRSLVPSVFLCFYSLTNDRSAITLQDNHLKSDVNQIKATLARSGYKTRLVVILLGNDGGDGDRPLSSEDTQERLEIIRKGIGLDPKSLVYVGPQESPEKLKRAADQVLSLVFPISADYYRDLARHAKKKRSRGLAPQPTVPPTSGTSRTLSLSGWNFRYDFKSAIFADFRQDLDAAAKSFEQAYEGLLGPDILEFVPSWSPRWNEARLLADIISIHCIRLYMSVGQTSFAVRRWQSHRDRIGDVVERVGRGTGNYGWFAWEARWALVMAQLIEKIDLAGLSADTMTLYHPPEKGMMAERLQPWELLHHTGYWYRMAAKHYASRRRLAHAMPEDDRQPPDTSPASQVASKAYTYDTYLCPEPHQEFPLSGTGVDHTQLIVDCLGAARKQYQARNQLRIAFELSLESAHELANLGKWSDVVSVLGPIWDDASFRSEGWLDISEEICWLMRRSAAKTGRPDLVVAADWELMNKKFSPRSRWHYDLGKSLEGVQVESKPTLGLSNTRTPSFVSAGFVFRHKESKAGRTCVAQVHLTSNAFTHAAPTVLDSLRIHFQGSLKPIVLCHKGSGALGQKRQVIVERLSLAEDLGVEAEADAHFELGGQCDLTLAPGTTRVYEMTIPLREPGEVEASSVQVSYRSEAFDLDYTFQFHETDDVVGWFANGSARPRGARQGERMLHIQPRPPKMEIQLVDPLDQYYANELVELQFKLVNGEDESASVRLDVHLFCKDAPGFAVEAGGEEQRTEGGVEEAVLTGFVLGTISKDSSSIIRVTIDPAEVPTSYDLHLRASYHLESDAATPIMQMLPVQLNVVGAFEANYNMSPRLHPDRWPSLFDHEGVMAGEDEGAAVAANGLVQKWCLVCHYYSFANQDLEVVEMDLKVLSTAGGARCNVLSRPEMAPEGMLVAPKTMHEAQFDLVAQKMSLDDRQPVTIDLAFVIRWKRRGEGTANTTRMPVGKYLVLGTEPRVLASVYHSPRNPPLPDVVRLDVTVENPSNHFLTFGLAMEPSNDFGFSGPKQTTLHLLPMARRTTTYRLLPTVRGAYLRPGLVVRDKYFQKTLRVIPTEGMKIDQEGLLVWVPGEVGQEAPRGAAEEEAAEEEEEEEKWPS